MADNPASERDESSGVGVQKATNGFGLEEREIWSYLGAQKATNGFGLGEREIWSYRLPARALERNFKVVFNTSPEAR